MKIHYNSILKIQSKERILRAAREKPEANPSYIQGNPMRWLVDFLKETILTEREWDDIQNIWKRILGWDTHYKLAKKPRHCTVSTSSWLMILLINSNLCLFFPHSTKQLFFLQHQARYPKIQLSSDTVYPEIASDFMVDRLRPARLSPWPSLPRPISSPSCYPCFRSVGYRWTPSLGSLIS